jgi:hypothetical protein
VVAGQDDSPGRIEKQKWSEKICAATIDIVLEEWQSHGILQDEKPLASVAAMSFAQQLRWERDFQGISFLSPLRFCRLLVTSDTWSLSVQACKVFGITTLQCSEQVSTMQQFMWQRDILGVA